MVKVSHLKDLKPQAVSHDAELVKHVHFRNNDIPNVPQFARCEVPPSFTITPHTHKDMHEVFYVEEGSGTFFIEKQSVKEQIPVLKGSCVIIEPGELHSVQASQDTKLVLVYFGITQNQ